MPQESLDEIHTSAKSGRSLFIPHSLCISSKQLEKTMKRIWCGLIVAFYVFCLVAPSLAEAATYACIPNRNSNVVSFVAVLDQTSLREVAILA
jgi:hypothetical protein